MTPQQQRNLPTTKGRREFWLIGVLVLLGTALRLWGLSRLGLVHFDEGVYAISGLWMITPSPEAQLYAKQILFSPPLYFSLVGASYWIFGKAFDQAAILVNGIIGGATIGVVWWVTRRWLGPGAGIAAAVLVAFGDFHILYSRTALTDVTFGFLFLLSLACITLTLETASVHWAIVSGLLIGALWNTKYHGWLPLAVALLVLVILAALDSQDRAHIKRLFLCWIVMAVVAMACYLPWAAYIQTKPGGYLALMKYQRKFLRLHWLGNFLHQAEALWYLDGWPSRFSPLLAYLAVLALRRVRWRSQLRVVCLTALLLLGFGFGAGGAGTAAIAAILAIPILLWQRSYLGWLVLGSLGLLFLLTPLYRPYPRLLLPLVLMLYIAAAAGISCVVENTPANRNEAGSERGRSSRLGWLAAGAVLLGALRIAVGLHPAPRTWMATDSVRNAVTLMAKRLPVDSRVFVHGAPEVAFYFLCAGWQAIPIDFPIDHPELTSRFRPGGEKHFLVTAIYSHREPQSRASLQRLVGVRLHPIGVYPVEPNDERLLSDFTPPRAMQYRLHPTHEYDLNLYQIAPAPEPENKLPER